MCSYPRTDIQMASASSSSELVCLILIRFDELEEKSAKTCSSSLGLDRCFGPAGVTNRSMSCSSSCGVKSISRSFFISHSSTM